MNRFSKYLGCAALAALACAPAMTRAEGLTGHQAHPGWRIAPDRHIAALELRLAPGWKTYWRAPGDTGIPPSFDWSASRNIDAVEVQWPAPEITWADGMRTIGYSDRVVLPLVVHTGGPGAAELRGTMDLGLCKDICLPGQVSFSAQLPAGQDSPDPVIAAALAATPLSAAEAEVRAMRCTVTAGQDGVRLRTEIDMPSAGGRESAVIEPGMAQVWVTEPQTQRSGAVLVAEARLLPMGGAPIALDRSALRVTILGDNYAVEVTGCE